MALTEDLVEWLVADDEVRIKRKFFSVKENMVLGIVGVSDRILRINPCT